MNAEDKAKIVLKIICPLLIIVVPIFLNLFFKMPNPTGAGHLDWEWYAIISFMCISGWFLSVFYILNLMGFIDKIKTKK